MASTDTPIVGIVGSVRIRRDRPFFVSERTVEARTRFSQRRAEMEGVFLDSAVSGASLCFPKVFIDERAVPLSLAELRQFRAVQVATTEVYLPDAPVAKEARFEGSLVFGGNKCGVIQLRSYLDYRALVQ